MWESVGAGDSDGLIAPTRLAHVGWGGGGEGGREGEGQRVCLGLPGWVGTCAG